LGQFNIAPVLDFEQKVSNLDTPYNWLIDIGKHPHSPKCEVDRNFNPFEDENKRGKTNPLGKEPTAKLGKPLRRIRI
jgi:hypothetical protein